MKKVILDLTPEEYFALTRNYPMGDQLYYIWVGIITCHGYKAPMTISELSVKHVEKYSYSVNVIG